MRIALVLIALVAMATSSAIPWNATSTVSSVRPRKTPHLRPIPVAATKCLNNTLSEEYYKGAKEKLLSWSQKGGNIRPGAYHAESDPDNGTGVTWYICNCKFVHADKAPQWELDQVQQILEDKCGEYQSGWVWSKKWQKWFGVVPTKYLTDRIKRRNHACPPHCFSLFRDYETEADYIIYGLGQD